MHELGIIIHVAKSLDAVAKENHLTRIGSVTLEIGEVSGIVPEYLTDCWSYYRKKSPHHRGGASDRDASGDHILRGVQKDISDRRAWEAVSALRQLRDVSARGE